MAGLVAAACAGVLLAPSPAAAAPAPEGGSGVRAATVAATADPGSGFWAKQKRVTAVADALVAASRTLPRRGGFAGLVAAPDKSGITLYWKGRVPAQVRQAVRTDRRVTVRVVPAPYTEHQLTTARERVLRQRGSLPGRLTSIGPSPDGKGLLVGMAREGGKPVAARKATSFAREVSGLGGGVAVVRVNARSPQASTGRSPGVGARAAGRNGQQAYGGAKWDYWLNNQHYSGCSTGFAVRYPGTSVNLMTSAAHCGEPWGKAYSPENPSSRPFGWIDTVTRDRDINVMYPEQSGAGRFFQPGIWWGPWVGSPSGQQIRQVDGLSANYVGLRVCSSGQASGTICDITVRATEQTIVFPNGQPVHRTVEVTKPNGRPVWGSADSGGPVATPSGSYVYANGIISASDKDGNPATCQGNTDRRCSSLGWFANIETYLREQGLYLLTR
jgi:hypothetical protein